MPSSMKKSDNWFSWLIHENPDGIRNIYPLILAYHGDVVVGMIVLSPTILFSNGEEYNVSWGRDLYVDPKYRRENIALMLVNEWSALYDMALGAGVSENASKMYTKYAWTYCGRVNQYEKILMSVDAIRNSVEHGLRKACLILSAMIYSYVIQCTNMDRCNIDVVEVKMFDDRVNDLWNKAKFQYGNICRRDLPILKWKYIRHPYNNYMIYEAKISEKYRGYAVVRIVDQYTAKIVDILTEKNDIETRTAIIKNIEDQLRIRGVRKIICWCKCSQLERSLIKRGYIKTYLPCDFVFKSKRRNLAEARNDWYITGADSDLDR